MIFCVLISDAQKVLAVRAWATPLLVRSASDQVVVPLPSSSDQ